MSSQRELSLEVGCWRAASSTWSWPAP